MSFASTSILLGGLSRRGGGGGGCARRADDGAAHGVGLPQPKGKATLARQRRIPSCGYYIHHRYVNYGKIDQRTPKSNFRQSPTANFAEIGCT